MRISFWRACAAAVLLACVAATPRTGSSALLLNVPTITGSTSIAGFTTWIELQSYSVGVQSAKTGLGKPTASALLITKPVDATSPAFANEYFSGKPFAGTTKLYDVSVKNGVATASLQLELHNAVVVADSTAAGDSGALETISISFDAIQYCVPGSSGSPVCKAWNFANNTPVYPTDKK